MRIHWASLIVLFTLALIGCGVIPVSRRDENPHPLESLEPPEGEITKMTSTPPMPYNPGLQSLVEDARADLAQRLNISESEINVLDAREVVWPDASLGCPQPGMVYKQVPEDGALIILQADGLNYQYHNGGSRGLFLCETVYKDPNPPPKLDIFNLTPPKTDPSTPDNSIPPGEDQ